MHNPELESSSHASETYFQRMASSLGDKKRILDYLPKSPGRILEVGSGGGELTLAMIELGHEVVAIDPNPDSIAHLEKLLPSDTRILPMYAEQIGSIRGKFDAIVFCSVLHEVFSYSSKPDKTVESVIGGVLRDSFSLLNPGGVVIVRDGVRPEPRASNGCCDKLYDDLIISDLYTADLAILYIRNSPWAQRDKIHTCWSYEPGEKFDSLLISAPSSQIMEIAYTINWGFAAMHREMQEVYGLYTLSGLSDLAQTVGLSTLESFSYLQPGYKQHLDPVAKLYEGEVGPRREWYDSNAIWVLQKPSI